MKKLLPVVVVLAMSVPAANANVLTDAAAKAVSLTKTAVRVLVVRPTQKVASIARNLTVGAFNVTDNVLTGADNLVK